MRTVVHRVDFGSLCKYYKGALSHRKHLKIIKMKSNECEEISTMTYYNMY